MYGDVKVTHVRRCKSNTCSDIGATSHEKIIIRPSFDVNPNSPTATAPARQCNYYTGCLMYRSINNKQPSNTAITCFMAYG